MKTSFYFRDLTHSVFNNIVVLQENSWWPGGNQRRCSLFCQAADYVDFIFNVSDNLVYVVLFGLCLIHNAHYTLALIIALYCSGNIVHIILITVHITCICFLILWSYSFLHQWMTVGAKLKFSVQNNLPWLCKLHITELTKPVFSVNLIWRLFQIFKVDLNTC